MFAVVVLAGCQAATPAEAPTRTTSGAAVVTATATASSMFDTQRTFRLELSGVGRDVHVTSLQLRSPWFQPVEPVARTVTIPGGGRRLVPLPYGDAVCPAERVPAERAAGELVVTTDDGQLVVPLADRPEGLLERRQARECAVAAAAGIVDLAFGVDWTQVGPRAVTGVLAIDPAVGHTVEVLEVEGNIVFTQAAATSLPVRVAGPTEVPVRVAAARCDTHALIEAKRKFHHVVTLSIDGADPVVMEVEATGATRELFQRLVEACLDEQQ